MKTKLENVRLMIGGFLIVKGKIDNPEFEKKFKKAIAEEAWKALLYRRNHSHGFLNASVLVRVKLFYEGWKKH